MKTREEIAEKVRLQAEAYAPTTFTYINPTTLKNSCTVCSAALATLFEKEGYRSFIIVVDGTLNGHCFVYSDSQVYDITATQFWSVPKVYTPLDFKRYMKEVINLCGDKTIIRHFPAKNLRAFKHFVDKWAICPTPYNITKLLSC